MLNSLFVENIKLWNFLMQLLKNTHNIPSLKISYKMEKDIFKDYFEDLALSDIDTNNLFCSEKKIYQTEIPR